MIKSIVIFVVSFALAGLLAWFMDRSPEPNQPGSEPTPAATTSESVADEETQPAALATTYISAVDWPPAVTTLATPYACEEADSTTPSATSTVAVTINGQAWCRAETTEGAAGSLYTAYQYTTQNGTGTRQVSFTLRRPQCGNYGEPERAGCEQEIATFNPDAVIATLP